MRSMHALLVLLTLALPAAARGADSSLLILAANRLSSSGLGSAPA